MCHTMCDIVGTHAQVLFVLSESPPHHHARRCQSERECHPHAHQSVAQHEAAEVAHGQRDDEEGDERNEHQWLHIGDAAQRVGVVDLHAVAKLIDEERQEQREHSRRHLRAVGEPRTYVVAQQEDGAAKHHLKHHHQVQTRRHRVAHVLHVALTVEVACAYSHRSPKSVVDHERELRDGCHHLVRCQGNGAEPAHHDDGERERRCLHTHLQRNRGA